MGIVLIVILAMAAMIAALGFAVAGYSMRIKGQTLDEARQWQASRYDLSFYDELEKTDYEVRSFDGYVLHVQKLTNPSPSGKYVIVSHGYTDNRIGSLKYAREYLALGFDVVIYDLRGHGLNAPTFCTYTVREAKDLMAIIGDTRKRFCDLKLLGLHGESLGAATTAAAMQYKPAVDFAVADCGFAEIESILRSGLKGFHLPEAFVRIASVCAKLRFGFGYSEMRPVDCLKDNSIPMLFIHGERDGFIPTRHSFDMCAATKGPARVVIIPNAKHAASVLTDPVMYREALESFIRKVEASATV